MAGSRLGSLVVRLAAELAGYKRDLDQAAQATEQAAERIEKGADAASSSTQKMGETATGVAQQVAALGPGAVVAAAGVGLLFAAVGTLGFAAFKGAKEQSAFEKALILSGNAAGATSAELGQMAQNIGRVVGTQAQAAAALTALAGSGQVAAGNLQKFGEAAVKMERTTGQSVDETVKQFVALGEDPVKASLRLNEGLNFLTAATFEQIKAAVALGDQQTAASLAQNALADATLARTAQVEKNLGLLERAWRGIVDVAKGAWDAMLDVGRESTVANKLSFLDELIASAEKRARTVNPNDPSAQARAEQQLQALGAQRAALEAVTVAAKESARAQGEKAAAEKAGIAAIGLLEAANERALTKQERANKALGAYRAELDRLRAVNPNSALLDPALIQKTEAAILATGAAAGVARKGVDEAQKALDLYNELVARSAGLNANFSQSWDRLNTAFRAGKIGLDELVLAQKELLKEQQFSKDAAAAEKKVRDELAKTMAEFAKAQEAGVASAIAAAAQAEAQLQAYGLLKSEVQALGLAQLQQARDAAALAGEDVSQIERRIEAQRRLIAATQGIEVREANAKAAKDAAAAWEKAADQINQSLTDAMLRAFDSGKGFFQTLWNSITNLFKTTVLRLLIQPVSGGLASALAGFSGTANAGVGAAAGGGGNLLAQAQGVKAITEAIGGGFAALGSATTAGFQSFAVSSAGQALGLSSLEGAVPVLTESANAAAAALGSFASVASGALAGVAVGSFLAGDKKVIGLDGTTTSAIGAAIGAAVGSSFPVIGTAVGAFLGGVVGGGVNALFGRGPAKLQSTGVSGTLSATGGADVEAFANFRAKGGVFRKDKFTQQVGEVPDELKAVMSAVVATAASSAKAYAAAIGLSAEAVDGFAKDINLTFAAGLDPEEIKKQITTELEAFGPSLVTAVFGSALEGFARQGETVVQTFERLANSMTTVNSALTALRIDLLDVSVGGADAASKLIDASGGVEAFTTNAGTFFDNFFTDTEKRFTAFSNINRTLESAGLAVDASTLSRDAFRALAESQDLMTDSGRAAFTALLSVSGAFAELVPASDQAAAALRQQADALAEQQRAAEQAARAAEQLASTNGRLQDQLDVLTGAQTERSLQLRDATDESTKALLEQIFAQQDMQAASQAAAQAIQQAAQDAQRAAEQAAQESARAAEQLASTNARLQDQLDVLTGAQTDRMLQLRDATDESTKALLEQIFAQQDMQAAAQAAAQAIQQAAQDAQRAAEQLASTNGRLQDQLDVLTGAQTDRSLQLRDATDASTKALLEQIFAQQDMQAAQRASEQAAQEAQRAAEQAAQESARAAEQLKSAWQSVTDSIFAEVARIRGLTGSGAGSFAGAQAQFAITTAQARAGDQNAAKLLPELSRTLLTLAEANASTLTELRRIQGQTAASLAQTGTGLAGAFGLSLPSFDVGTSFVPQDMIAQIHKGEAIIPAAFNAGGNAELLDEIRALRQEVAALRQTSRDTADNTRTTARTLVNVTRGGEAMQTQVAA